MNIVIQTPLSKMSKEELDFRKMMSELYFENANPFDWGAGERSSGRPRSLFISPVYANHSQLSSILVEVNGSPPKGTMLIVPDSYGIIGHVVFLERGNVKTLVPARRGLPDPNIGPKKEVIRKRISDFIVSLRIPQSDPEGRGCWE